MIVNHSKLFRQILRNRFWDIYNQEVIVHALTYEINGCSFVQFYNTSDTSSQIGPMGILVPVKNLVEGTIHLVVPGHLSVLPRASLEQTKSPQKNSLFGSNQLSTFPARAFDTSFVDSLHKRIYN